MLVTHFRLAPASIRVLLIVVIVNIIVTALSCILCMLCLAYLLPTHLSLFIPAKQHGGRAHHSCAQKLPEAWDLQSECPDLLTPDVADAHTGTSES